MTAEEDANEGDDGESGFKHKFRLFHGVAWHGQAGYSASQAADLNTLWASVYPQSRKRPSESA